MWYKLIKKKKYCEEATDQLDIQGEKAHRDTGQKCIIQQATEWNITQGEKTFGKKGSSERTCYLIRSDNSCSIGHLECKTVTLTQLLYIKGTAYTLFKLRVSSVPESEDEILDLIVRKCEEFIMQTPCVA